MPGTVGESVEEKVTDGVTLKGRGWLFSDDHVSRYGSRPLPEPYG